MSGASVLRKIHKWLALAVGIQLLLWAVSGFYMVVVRIDIVHGDMLVRNVALPIDVSTQDVVSVSDLINQYPKTTQIVHENFMGSTVYRVLTPEGARLVSAQTGELLSPLSRETVSALVLYHYAGNGRLASLELIERNPPGEIRFMTLPVWRADFDDRWGTSFYIQPDSGRFASRRHTLWRIFDFLWMLHIMDYQERENVNNRLLQVVTLFALVLGISGTWLLFFSFRRPGREGST